MTTSPNFKLYRQDWYLLIIFIMMAVAIVAKSYFSSYGYLTGDSDSYLICAKNLIEGNGYYVSAYGNTGQDRDFFAIWPAGYPTLIFITAKLTGLTVFWASKLLNIFLIGVILGIFRALFKHNAYVYGLILLFSAYIEIFSYTWSETIFITALLWFSTSIYLFIVNPKKTILLYFSIMLSALLLFMSRYIGAFSFGLIGLLGLYYGVVKKEKLKSITLIGIAVINIGIMVVYLYHNYIETGFPTGMQRTPSPETNLQLLIMLIKALIAESVISIHRYSTQAVVLFIVQIFLFGFLIWKYSKNKIIKDNNQINGLMMLSYVFGAVGLTYLFFIILFRWITHFDDYTFRLLGPGSFLIFIALLNFLQQKYSTRFFDKAKYVLIAFGLFSYLLFVPYRTWILHQAKPTYSQTIQALEKKYSTINIDSIVVYAPKGIQYLYPNIETRSPYSEEKWVDFLYRIDPDEKKTIYLFVPKKDLSSEKYDQSVVDFVRKYNEGTLVKIQ